MGNFVQRTHVNRKRKFSIAVGRGIISSVPVRARIQCDSWGNKLHQRFVNRAQEDVIAPNNVGVGIADAIVSSSDCAELGRKILLDPTAYFCSSTLVPIQVAGRSGAPVRYLVDAERGVGRARYHKST